MRLASVLITCLLLQACASVVVSGRDSLPAKQLLTVPFVSQQDFYCGPAALEEIARFHGLSVDQQSIAKQVFIPGKKGSLAIEMQAAARQLGLLPYPLDKNLSSIISEVAADNPVLVFQNLGFAWWPQWHYAVVVGYDLYTDELILHSGSHKNYRLSFATFTKTWARANNWARVLTDSSYLPETAKPASYISTAYDFEQAGDVELAMSFYNLAAEEWPASKPVLTAQANVALNQGDISRAISLFAQLVQMDGDDPALWNNYAFALLAKGCANEAITAINTAISLAADPVLYQNSRDEIASSADTSQSCPGIFMPSSDI
ncbi:Beta-barrel assembly-enhancing protease [Zhongshania aliphaticivorans]|uniref:Beta-barrel assembly-enhancing protease n=1 Tax=Zhongshania aliphaticivorans TaxID=1470434 RepID=A0A5S9PHX2_9GAMM|nr:PA2778 family cysteine peptidase [Zhongshania aliphaticivorans]CAA0103596.1 Beta-barrel assembly-enhancing protease [Zhongshania aliphaticivorans]CAA0113408.1 Beta-barrel assembly-enhancing protease [Zhongshania aliphaticivorans]